MEPLDVDLVDDRVVGVRVTNPVLVVVVFLSQPLRQVRGKAVVEEILEDPGPRVPETNVDHVYPRVVSQQSYRRAAQKPRVPRPTVPVTAGSSRKPERPPSVPDSRCTTS